MIRGVAVLLGVGAMIALPSQLWSQTVCRPPDSTSAALIRELSRYATATSGDDQLVRDSLHLPLVSPSQVVLTTQEAVCKKANQAYQSKLTNSGSTAFSGRVYVVQIGSFYAALDPAFNYGDPRFWTVVIMDSRYKPLSIM